MGAGKTPGSPPTNPNRDFVPFYAKRIGWDKKGHVTLRSKLYRLLKLLKLT